VSDPTRFNGACTDRSWPRGDTVLVYSYDHATLQLIRDFLEPLGFTVELAAVFDARSVEAELIPPSHASESLDPPAETKQIPRK
jgi:hypothetical protein